MYEYANVFGFKRFNYRTQDVSYFTEKLSLSVCAPKASGFHVTLVSVVELKQSVKRRGIKMTTVLMFFVTFFKGKPMLVLEDLMLFFVTFDSKLNVFEYNQCFWLFF